MANFEISPTRSDYADVPIEEGFEWSPVLPHLSEEPVHLVVFRSIRREDADVPTLMRYDNEAHDEARDSSGLLYYFQGEAREDGHGLSFCLWESQEEAREASQKPK